MVNLQKTHTTVYTRPFNGLWSGTTRVGRYQKELSPLTPIRINVLPLSSFSICNDPWHPLYTAYVLDSPHVQPLFEHYCSACKFEIPVRWCSSQQNSFLNSCYKTNLREGLIISFFYISCHIYYLGMNFAHCCTNELEFWICTNCKNDQYIVYQPCVIMSTFIIDVWNFEFARERWQK